MFTKALYVVLISLVLGVSSNAQRERRDGPPKGEWVKVVDANDDGKVDAGEFQSAIVRTFSEFDRNGDGVLQQAELPRDRDEGRGGPLPMGPPAGDRPGRPRGEFGGPGRQQGPPRDGLEKKLLPPFFFMDAARSGDAISRSAFEAAAKSVFSSMDADRDGTLSIAESRPPKHREGPPPPPNAKFIAAELRFGDKLVKDQPFSADTVIEDTRRLFDGSTVTKRSTGAIYRDTAGRTRREQPLEMVGGFSVVGTDSKPQMLVFINDFASGTQYFLDANNKIARRHPLGGNPPDPPKPRDAKTESLGTRTIEGVSCQGTRVTFEIPVGHIGNDKPITVVTEEWFSPELQMLVYSKHVDPLAGEHVFKLINIRRAEPAADLFAVPAGFKVVGGRTE